MTTTPDTKPNILQRINAVMKAVDYIQKEKKAGMRYSIVSHDAVTAKVRPLMVEHGIVYYPSELRCEQVGNRTQASMSVRFVNIDDPSDFISVETAGYGIDDQDKGPGKAISYAVKYALLKAFGLESGDDPDLEQDAVHKPPMPSVQGTQGASKAGHRATYDKLVQAIRNAPTLKALTDWYAANVKEIDALPADWIEDLRVEYSDRMAELKKALAA